MHNNNNNRGQSNTFITVYLINEWNGLREYIRFYGNGIFLFFQVEIACTTLWFCAECLQSGFPLLLLLFCVWFSQGSLNFIDDAHSTHMYLLNFIRSAEK